MDAFLRQASLLDEAHSSASPVAWYLRRAQLSQLSHPLPVLRAREVMEWSKTAQGKRLKQLAAMRAEASNWQEEEQEQEQEQEQVTKS